MAGFVTAKIKQAATLESINYSFYILTILFMLFTLTCVIFLHIRKTNKDGKNKTEIDNTKKKENNKFEKISNIILKTILIIIFACGFLFIMGESMVLNDIFNFKHNLRILTPYMTGTEKDMIISEWSQMNSFDDYRNIYSKLNEIAQNQNIKLRFNRFY